jgi:hypothetical protein
VWQSSVPLGEISGRCWPMDKIRLDGEAEVALNAPASKAR